MFGIKTISIRLDDSAYEELGMLLNEMGQTKQTFYETYTRTVLREKCIPFIIKGNVIDYKGFNKMSAFESLEAMRKRNAGTFDYKTELGEALDEKYGHID